MKRRGSPATGSHLLDAPATSSPTTAAAVAAACWRWVSSPVWLFVAAVLLIRGQFRAARSVSVGGAAGGAGGDLFPPRDSVSNIGIFSDANEDTGAAADSSALERMVAEAHAVISILYDELFEGRPSEAGGSKADEGHGQDLVAVVGEGGKKQGAADPQIAPEGVAAPNRTQRRADEKSSAFRRQLRTLRSLQAQDAAAAAGARQVQRGLQHFSPLVEKRSLGAAFDHEAEIGHRQKLDVHSNVVVVDGGGGGGGGGGVGGVGDEDDSALAASATAEVLFAEEKVQWRGKFQHDTDIVGATDLADVQADDADSCALACADAFALGCQSFSFTPESQRCSLKRGVGISTSRDGVVSAVLLEKPSQLYDKNRNNRRGEQYSPAKDGQSAGEEGVEDMNALREAAVSEQLLQDARARWSKALQPDTYFVGGDLEILETVDDAVDCAELCAARRNQGCLGFTFHRAQCFLKNMVASTHRTGAVSGLMTMMQQQHVSDAALTKTSSSRSAAAAAAASVLSLRGFEVLPGEVVITGADLEGPTASRRAKNLVECAERCRKSVGNLCKAFSFALSSRRCYLKHSSSGPSRPTPGVISAKLLEKPHAALSSQNAPGRATRDENGNEDADEDADEDEDEDEDADGEVGILQEPVMRMRNGQRGMIVPQRNTLASGNAAFELLEDTDFVGGDLKSVHADDVESCARQCAAAGASTCLGFTYLETAQRCYLKSAVAETKRRHGILSGRMMPDGNDDGNDTEQPHDTESGKAVVVVPPSVATNLQSFNDELSAVLAARDRAEQASGHRGREGAVVDFYIALKKFNDAGLILNGRTPDERDAGLKEEAPQVVIAVRAHSRYHYLRLLFDSLRGASVQALRNTIVVVSCDGYFEEVVDVLREVDFIRVKLVLFPHSRHLLQHVFPASLPRDCKFGKHLRQAPGCKGDKDQYGNYREAHIVALKHHFWWHLVQLWQVLDGQLWGHSDDGSGPIGLFLEEDHMLASDFFETLLALDHLCSQDTGCRAVQLHNGRDYATSLRNARATDFYAATRLGQFSNLGFAFRRDLWEDLKGAADFFCTHDDYNWDFTIINVMQLKVPVRALQPVVARVQHVGKCGLHTKTKDQGMTADEFQAKCKAAVQAWPAFEADANSPERWSVDLRSVAKDQPTKRQGWGGWNDARDHNLCKSMLSSANDGEAARAQFKWLADLSSAHDAVRQ